jgi:hypothetical protein
VTQLGLPLPTLRHDALVGRLPIAAPVEGPDGSLTARWLRGAASNYPDRFPAWEVRPVPEDCLAWESGARWFYGANTSTVTGEWSSSASGPMRGVADRDVVARFAQLLCLRLELRRELNKVCSRASWLRLRERNAGIAA